MKNIQSSGLSVLFAKISDQHLANIDIYTLWYYSYYFISLTFSCLNKNIFVLVWFLILICSDKANHVLMIHCSHKKHLFSIWRVQKTKHYMQIQGKRWKAQETWERGFDPTLVKTQ